MTVKLHGLRCMSLTNCRKPAKPSRHAVASLKSERVPDLSASFTMGSSIYAVTGFFFTTGFAREHWSPSSIAFTNGCADGEARPAPECIHATALYASSTAALHLDSSLRYCKYKTNSCGLAGMGSSLWLIAHVLHLLYTLRYFLTCAVCLATKNSGRQPTSQVLYFWII